MIGDVREMERCAFNVFRRAAQSSNDPAETVRVAVTEGPGNFASARPIQISLPQNSEGPTSTPSSSDEYQRLYGVPKSLADIPNHRFVKQRALQIEDSAYARVLGLPCLESIRGIKTN